MGPTYNSLLLEQLFFPLLNFSLFFLLFSFPLFVPYFFFFFFMCSYFFSFFLFSLKKYSHFLILYQRTKELLCRIVKIYLEDVYDIFFIINGLCISLLHTQCTFLYIFLLHCPNFIKMCKEMCTNHDLFFLLVDINLNHNVILYFFITLLILY